MIDHQQVVKDLRDNVKTIREKRKMNRQEFSELTGISRPYLSQIESGKRDIGLAALVKIANGLDMSINEILTSPKEINERLEIESIKTDINKLISRLDAVEKERSN